MIRERGWANGVYGIRPEHSIASAVLTRNAGGKMQCSPNSGLAAGRPVYFKISSSRIPTFAKKESGVQILSAKSAPSVSS